MVGNNEKLSSFETLFWIFRNCLKLVNNPSFVNIILSQKKNWKISNFKSRKIQTNATDNRTKAKL